MLWLLVDSVLAVAAVPVAVVSSVFRRIGAHRLRITARVFRKFGVFPVRDHYYEPLVNPDHLRHGLGRDRDLPGIQMNEQGQLDLLDTLQCSAELEELSLRDAATADDPTAFCVDNASFGPGDAEFLYQFLRKHKPQRLIEIGSGNSTKIAKAAIQRNDTEASTATQHICIEPYEQPWLEQLDVQVVRQRVEDCDPGMFQDLGPGDLLFIDSSHVIRPQGDVLFEYLEILPSLASGVFVHIHDIFTPRDYPETWIKDRIRLWNEQYLVEALLSNTNRYQIVAALNFLKNHHYERLSQVCPYLDQSNAPGSLYLAVK